MGFAYYWVDSLRDYAGYSVADTCNEGGCAVAIDRGLAYACGGEPGQGEMTSSEAWYCERYFCYGHLYFTDFHKGNICARCIADAELYDKGVIT